MSVILSRAALNDQQPMPGVSKNYEFMPTTRIIDIMQDNGFTITKCLQGSSRKPDGSLYAKHRVHFRKQGQQTINDVQPEIIILNSHNRGSALRFLTGFIRFVCENGLVAGDIISDTNKIYHTNKNPFDLVMDRINYSIQHVDSKLEIIKDMRNTHMSLEDQDEFVYDASKLPSLKDKYFNNHTTLLNCRREDDASNTVWSIFNRIQENIKKGSYEIITAKNKVRKARPIKSIDMDIKYNQELWRLAESFVLK